MATYIQGLTDVAAPITPFTPDYGMMQKALTTLQSRYEQGFASVKNAYNQVLNAPLSDGANKVVRDGFIKDAEQKLKNLSSVDLSVPENQVTAEGVFAPFWEDNLILQDANLTKWYQGELQKAQATRDSKDEKVRSQYSDAAVFHLQDGLEKLQSAGRDPSKYAKLEKRRFVPFEDVKAYVNEQAKLSGFTVEWESEEGPYLKKIENGERSITAFETFAHNILNDQFQDQFNVMGSVEKAKRIKNKQRLNPALTDDQALAEVAKEMGTEYQKMLNSRTDALQKEMELVTAKMKPYLSMTTQLDANQDKAFSELAMHQLTLEKQLQSAKEHANDYKLKEQAILANPDGYFASLMKDREVKEWANARAAGEKVSYTLNPAWKENMDIARYQREMDLKVKEYGLKEQEFGLKQKALQLKAVKDGVLGIDDLDSDLFGDSGDLSGDGSGSGLSGGSGGGLSTVNSLNPEKAGRYVSRDASNVAKTDSFQLFQERQVQRWGVAHQELFSTGAGGWVLYGMGVSTADAAKYMRAMKNYSMDLTGHGLSQQDKTLLHDLTKTLTGADVPGRHAGFFQLRTRLLDKMRTTLEDKLQDGGTGLTEEDSNMLGSYITSTWAIREHDALEEERKRLAQQQIVQDSKSYSRILAQRNGKYDVLGADDAVKDFRDVDVIDSNGEKKRLSARDFAEAYLSGNYNADAGWIKAGSKTYQIVKTLEKWQDPDPLSAFPSERYGVDLKKYNLDVIKEKYGTSAEQKKLREKLNNAVVSKLPEYQSEAGKLGFVVRYDLGAKDKPDVGSFLIQEAAEQGNHLGIYVDGVLSKDDKMNEAIVKLVKQGHTKLKDYASAALLKTGGSGRPMLEVVLQPVSSSDKTKVLGRELIDLANKKTIAFELHPEASGETLRKLRFNSGMYVFGSLLRGQPMSSDPILKAAGFSFDITPDDPEHPTKAIVDVHAKEFVNGAYKPVLKRKEYSFSQMTPDELVHNFYGFFFQQLKKNMAAQQVYQAQVGQGGQGGRTVQQIMAAVRGR